MPITLADDYKLEVAGDLATATVTVIVTNAQGIELGRQQVTATVNHKLRADDPNRRGMKINAKPRLRQLLVQAAREAAQRIRAEKAPVATFADVDTEAKSDLVGDA